MSYTDFSFEDITAWLKENLSEERFVHSLGAMEMAEELALRFNEDVEKAKIAALLHDAAKDFSQETLLELLKNSCDEYLECELINYKTWHAPVSAFVAKDVFKVTDADILNSIRWHTLGRVGMSKLEMIVFISDKIERKTRECECREKIEKILNKHNSLEKAILKCFKMTLKSLVKRKLTICQQTVDVYNDLILQKD